MYFKKSFASPQQRTRRVANANANAISGAPSSVLLNAISVSASRDHFGNIGVILESNFSLGRDSRRRKQSPAKRR
jgi:hypothetical protein